MHLPRPHFLAPACLLLVLLGSCRGPSPQKLEPAPAAAARVWPLPPAEPRVKWVGQIATPADLGLRVSFFTRMGNFLTGGDRGREKLIKPFGLALDEAGNLCVTDTGANAVYFFDLAHRRSQRWTQIGGLSLISPVAIAKRNGLVYVADSGLRSVLVADEKGRLQHQIKEGLERPSGLALTADRLYIADAGAHCVLAYDLQGRLLFRFGARGNKPGEFNFPTHLAVDPQGRIHVTDAMNSRVQVFDREGHFLREIGSLGDGSGYFSRPKGVAVDRLGQIYVTDALFDNVQIFDPEGRFLLDFGSAGPLHGEFWMPAGIAIGADNLIYVADSYNGRIQIFQTIGQP